MEDTARRPAKSRRRRRFEAVHKWTATAAAVIALAISLYNFAELQRNPNVDMTLPHLFRLEKSGKAVHFYVQPTVATRFKSENVDLIRNARGDGRRRHRRLARQGAQSGAHTGPSPVHRARPGSKHHLIVDRHGTPLAVSLTGGNRHDATQFMPLRTPSHPSAGYEAGHAVAPDGCSPTAATTSTSTAASSGLGGSHRRSPAAAPRTVPGGAGPNGSSSGPSPGCISSNDCASATRYAPTSTSHCSNSPAASSA